MEDRVDRVAPGSRRILAMGYLCVPPRLGLARLQSDDATHIHLRAGLVLGTALLMLPSCDYEQSNSDSEP